MCCVEGFGGCEEVVVHVALVCLEQAKQHLYLIFNALAEGDEGSGVAQGARHGAEAGYGVQRALMLLPLDV